MPMHRYGINKFDNIISPTVSTMDQLKQENDQLKQELSLMRSVFETHYTSLVMNLRLKETKEGHMEWFDIQKISVSELKEFTQDHEILQYIEDKQIPYRDR